MATPVNTPGNSDPSKTEGQVEKAIADIEKQEVKVENAGTPAEENKEQAKLDTLLERFDAMIERMNGIDAKLAEPTVPAPVAKEVVAPEAPKGEEQAVEVQPESESKPSKRRLGAWGG